MKNDLIKKLYKINYTLIDEDKNTISFKNNNKYIKIDYINNINIYNLSYRIEYTNFYRHNVYTFCSLLSVIEFIKKIGN